MKGVGRKQPKDMFNCSGFHGGHSAHKKTLHCHAVFDFCFLDSKSKNIMLSL